MHFISGKVCANKHGGNGGQNGWQNDGQDGKYHDGQHGGKTIVIKSNMVNDETDTEKCIAVLAEMSRESYCCFAIILVVYYLEYKVPGPSSVLVFCYFQIG